MYEITDYLVLLARDQDVGTWTNVLIVVLLAVFWSLAGLIKARARKLEEKKQLQQQHQKPPGASPQGGRGVGVPAPRQRAAGATAIPVPTRQYRPQPPPASGPSAREPQITQPSRRDIDSVGPDDSTLSPLLPVAEHETLPHSLHSAKSGSDAADAISDDDDSLQLDRPEKLRIAILHYEILGPPLSLRAPDLP